MLDARGEKVKAIERSVQRKGNPSPALYSTLLYWPIQEHTHTHRHTPLVINACHMTRVFLFLAWKSFLNRYL